MQQKHTKSRLKYSIISPSCPRNPCHRSSTPGARTSSVGVLVLVLVLLVVVGGGGGVDVLLLLLSSLLALLCLCLWLLLLLLNQETMEDLGLQQVLCKLKFCQRTHAISMICLCKTLMFQVCSAGTVSWHADKTRALLLQSFDHV
jgi:hypothetical protein